jgi:hypothetical protein
MRKWARSTKDSYDEFKCKFIKSVTLKGVLLGALRPYASYRFFWEKKKQGKWAEGWFWNCIEVALDLSAVSVRMGMVASLMLECPVTIVGCASAARALLSGVFSPPKDDEDVFSKASYPHIPAPPTRTTGASSNGCSTNAEGRGESKGHLTNALAFVKEAGERFDIIGGGKECCVTRKQLDTGNDWISRPIIMCILLAHGRQADVRSLLLPQNLRPLTMEETLQLGNAAVTGCYVNTESIEHDKRPWSIIKRARTEACLNALSFANLERFISSYRCELTQEDLTEDQANMLRFMHYAAAHMAEHDSKDAQAVRREIAMTIQQQIGSHGQTHTQTQAQTQTQTR